LRGAIVAAAGFGAYWPVGRSVHASQALCLLFQYMSAIPPRAVLARYIASSARRASAGPSPPILRCRATPTLAPACTRMGRIPEPGLPRRRDAAAAGIGSGPSGEPDGPPLIGAPLGVSVWAASRPGSASPARLRSGCRG
jgi:hypothetical protein